MKKNKIVLGVLLVSIMALVFLQLSNVYAVDEVITEDETTNIAKLFEDKIMPLLLTLASTFGGVVIGLITLFKKNKTALANIKDIQDILNLKDKVLVEQQEECAKLMTSLAESYGIINTFKIELQGIKEGLAYFIECNIDMVSKGQAKEAIKKVLGSEEKEE